MLYVKLVRRAARALDAYKTEGQRWVLDVDLDRLDQASVYNCVLGQIYGHYMSPVAVAFMNQQSSSLQVAFGYNDWSGARPHYATLTWAWRRELRRRRVELLRRDNASLNDDNARYGGRREWLG